MCVSSLANRAAAHGVRGILSSLRWKPASFSTVAAEQGVALPSRTVDLLEADLNIIASVFPLIDDRQLSDAEVVAGPIFARSREALPAELHGLASRSRPAVYVGLGSSANRSLAVAVLDQVARLDVDVVTSAGQYLTQVDRRNLPPSVQVFDFLPAHRLAGLIDASVTHGGAHGRIRRSLHRSATDRRAGSRSMVRTERASVPIRVRDPFRLCAKGV